MDNPAASRHPAAAHPETGGALDRRAQGEGSPETAVPYGLLRAPTVTRRAHTAAAVHRFWRERMRDAPSVDHALACIMSGLELDRATTGGAS